MKRSLALTLVNAKPPPSAKNASGSPEITLDLRDVFHHAYIDKHERPPVHGTNPLFQEYAPLVVPGDHYLRFESVGIAVGDYRATASHDLGRAFARAILADYGYRWFAHWRHLVRRSIRGWSVRRRTKGKTPDWLVTGTPPAALAEAKGTHAAIKSTTPIVRTWRRQVGNAIVTRGGVQKSMKGWIAATRWVTSAQPKTIPSVYVEDPRTPGEELTPDDVPDLEWVIATIHTINNLRRLGLTRVADRLGLPPEMREYVPPAKVMTWRCAAEGLTGFTFVGRTTGGEVADMSPWWPLWHLIDWLEDWLPSPRIPATWWRAILGQQWFDGLVASIPHDLVNERLPPRIEGLDAALQTPGVHLLADGSFIAPAELMSPSEGIEL